MKSPFPGMDPYLENPAYFGDFHSTFVNYWREAIADALPENYIANLNEQVYLVEQDPDSRKKIVPDISIVQEEARIPSHSSATKGMATLEPVTVPLQIFDWPTQIFIEILHQPDQSLVTVLELLSPTNKENGWREYQAKRKAILNQQINLVELDLLMRGRRMQDELPSGDFFYLVSRPEMQPDCQVYSWTVRQSLPTLPVPLRSPDADVLIDLGTVFATAYQRGRFQKRLPYQKSIPEFLREEDQSSAQSLVSR